MRPFLRPNAVKLATFAFGASLAMTPSAVQARALLQLNVQVAQALPILIAAGSVCIKYTYDTNGNRTAQIVTTIGPGPDPVGRGNIRLLRVVGTLALTLEV